MSIQTVSFRAPSEKIAALDRIAAGYQRDRTFLINEAIDNYVALQEHRDRLTLEAMADVDAGRVIDHAEVVAWVNSLGTDNPLPLPQVKI